MNSESIAPIQSTQVEAFFQQQSAKKTSSQKLLKRGVWLYFFLLIFEGALRKWFLPFLSTPLLIVRDPIALWVVFMALNKEIIKFNFYIVSITAVAGISFLTAIVFGHGNILVALYGLRILLIHFPFMFAIGKIFTSEDVIRLGRVTLWIAIPMAILIGLQFYSPQSAWVNRGVGGDEGGAGFSGALGFFRPPGTFSFTNGNSLFFGFVCMFIFYFFLEPGKVNRLLFISATVSLIAAVPLSLSRSLIFTTGICGAFMLFALTRKPQYAGKVALGIVSALVLFAIVSQLPFFQTALGATTTRFTSANESEGGLVQGVIGDRYFGGMLGAIQSSAQLPFWGYGLGMGTNVGAMLLGGKIRFLISEGEWGRLIGEIGLVLGLVTILIRLSFCAEIAILTYRRLKYNNFLPWMMLSFALLNIPQSQWAQPTALGFSTFAGGLVLAALRSKSSVNKNITV